MLWALIMAGGQGTRLWPLSRADCPKPLLKLVPGCKTLLEETLERISPVVVPERTWIIANAEHIRSIRRIARGIPPEQIVGEPISRNTFATVALGALWISKIDPEALVLTLPADHWIPDSKKFQMTVKKAAEVARETKSFCIFGVRANFPSSSYGYLRAGRKISTSVYELKQFIEKPSEQHAKRLLKTGRYVWHAGIFLAPAKTVLDAVLNFVPESVAKLNRIEIRKSRLTPIESFRALPHISFDYAVLERLKRSYLIRCDFDWCDVGSWKSFEGLWPKDKFQNSVWGSLLALRSRANIVYSADKPVCLYGVQDLAIVDTPDVLLVSRKDSGEGVRELVRLFSKKKRAGGKP